MKRSVLTTGTWLVLVGAALMIAAGVLNFVQRARRETPPWDGIHWTDTKQGIIAEAVEANSSGARARLLPGDHLIAVNVSGEKYEEIGHAKDVQIYLDQTQVGGQIHYLIERPSYPEESRLYYADIDNLAATNKWTPRALYINLIGLVYLFVGFFVLFKQGGRAPFTLHFATLCLAAFVFHFYTPLGSYRDLDLAIAFLKNAAFILFPPLFLHFCALYPLKQQLFANRRRTILLYLPAIGLLVLTSFIYLRDVLAQAIPPLRSIPPLSESFVELSWRVSFFHFVAALIASAALLVRTWARAKSAVVRQQLKWVVWGSLLAIAPFTLLYGVGYLLGAQSDPWLIDASVLPLVLIPLAFGYSVIRYRLMDVELVVRRVFVYALTTLAIAMLIGTVVYFGGIYAVGGDQSFTSGDITLRVVVAIVAMAGIVMLAAPVKGFLQERTDRLFYGERYDMRHSLLDFGRTLSATTALEPLLDALVNRLQEVMNVGRVAIFIEDKKTASGYRLARAEGLAAE